ncbi:hypothetical protein [Bacillus sp. EB01]|uniref:hypothetical protein n=1 Tax=Bacillus sp. EB01 TaxID=1347086 RepID=UPI0005C6ADF9|nr:hypothetical protein [Bacillus sp. EB01]
MKNLRIVLSDHPNPRLPSAASNTETWLLQPAEIKAGTTGRIPIPKFKSVHEARHWTENFADLITTNFETIEIHTDFYSDKVLAYMLTLKVVQRFPNRTALNPSFSKKKDGNAAKEMNVYHHLHQLVESGNFRAAKKLASNRFQNRKIVQLLDLAQGLRQFDFTSHELKTESYWNNLSETLAEIDPKEAKSETAFITEFRKVARRDQRAFIAFLHNYAELLYKDNNLIDFVVLYYRLAEETLLYALGWDINWAVYEDHKQFIIRKGATYFLKIPANERLSKHFHRYMRVLENEIYRLNGRPGVMIRPGASIGIEKLTGRDEFFARVYLFFKDPAFSKFLDLRHQGVSGHGFVDFNKADFEAILGQAPLEKMNPILVELNLMPGYSIFELISKAALALASEEVGQRVP